MKEVRYATSPKLEDRSSVDEDGVATIISFFSSCFGSCVFCFLLVASLGPVAWRFEAGLDEDTPLSSNVAWPLLRVVAGIFDIVDDVDGNVHVDVIIVSLLDHKTHAWGCRATVDYLTLFFDAFSSFFLFLTAPRLSSLSPPADSPSASVSRRNGKCTKTLQQLSRLRKRDGPSRCRLHREINPISPRVLKSISLVEEKR